MAVHSPYDAGAGDLINTSATTPDALTVKQQKHIPALDGLRGVAVIAVLLYHYAGGNRSHFALVRFGAHILKAGWAGVTLFFALSGFLITGILWDSFGKPHWWRNFYARRSLRILPLYYLALLLLLLGAVYAGTLHAALNRIWIPVLFLENMPRLSDLSAQIASPLAIFHFWSLAVEEQFYLIWPLLLVLQRSRKHALSLCLGIFLLSACFRAVVWTVFPNPFDYWQFLLSRAGELSLGGALAILYRSRSWHAVGRWALPVAIASLLGFVASSLVARTADLLSPVQLIAGLPSITLFCVSLIALSLQAGAVQRAMSAPWLRWIGSLSFGIYVYHILLGNLFRAAAAALFIRHGETAVLAGQFPIVIAGSIAAAWLSFRFFETPFLRLKRRYPSAPAA